MKKLSRRLFDGEKFGCPKARTKKRKMELKPKEVVLKECPQKILSMTHRGGV